MCGVCFTNALDLSGYHINYSMAMFAAVEMGLHFVAELNSAILESEDRVVFAEADVLARDYPGATLAHDDHAGLCDFAVSALNTQKLGILVCNVFGCAASFFSCHIAIYCVRMNIHETWGKIKYQATPFLEEAAIPLLVILVGLGGFGLGRMSTLEATTGPISITQAAAVGGSSDEATRQGGKVIASKTGTKYYFPWCTAATKIAEKSKIWFDDETAARAAGYTPAGNCKGLK